MEDHEKIRILERALNRSAFTTLIMHKTLRDMIEQGPVPEDFMKQLVNSMYIEALCGLSFLKSAIGITEEESEQWMSESSDRAVDILNKTLDKMAEENNGNILTEEQWKGKPNGIKQSQPSQN